MKYSIIYVNIFHIKTQLQIIGMPIITAKKLNLKESHPNHFNSAEERTFLEKLISKGKAAAKKLVHARILLLADQNNGEKVWSDQQISEAIHTSVPTIERVRKLFVEEGVEIALNRKKHSIVLCK